jgi:hypothetical protein
MVYFVGLDVSVKATSVCVVDDAGKVILEQKAATEPADIIAILTSLGVPFSRIGIEAGPLSQWLVNALTAANLPVICVETRHMKALLTAQQISKNLFVTLRDDQFGELWSEEPLQSSDAAEFLDLFRDPLLQLAVPPGDLVGALTQFTQKPRVLHCDHGLRGEILQQRDLLVGKGPDFPAEHSDCAAQNVVLAQRHGHPAPHTARFHHCAKCGGNTDRLIARRICEPNNLLAAHDPPRRRGIAGRCPWTMIPGPLGKLRVALCSDEMVALSER